MADLEKLSAAATQGEWYPDRTLCVDHASSERRAKEYIANKKFACALVNAFRNGELTPKEAKSY